MYFNFSAVSNFFPIYADLIRGHIEYWVLVFVGKGDEIIDHVHVSNSLLGNIASHKDEPDGYLTNHVTYDNLKATYCTSLLTVFRYLI